MTEDSLLTNEEINDWALAPNHHKAIAKAQDTKTISLLIAQIRKEIGEIENPYELFPELEESAECEYHYSSEVNRHFAYAEAIQAVLNIPSLKED